MKFKTEYLAIVLVMGIFVLTGCAGNTTAVNPPNTTDYNMSERITTKTPTTDNNLMGTNTNKDGNALTNDGYGTLTDGLFGNTTTDNNFGNNMTGNNGMYGTTGTLRTTPRELINLQTYASQCETKVNNVAGVQNSKVVILGDTAYVACNTNGTAPIADGVKTKIADAVKAAVPGITNCYVLTDTNAYDVVNSCATNLRNLGNSANAVTPITGATTGTTGLTGTTNTAGTITGAATR